jgi:hypothetical protein
MDFLNFAEYFWWFINSFPTFMVIYEWFPNIYDNLPIISQHLLQFINHFLTFTTIYPFFDDCLENIKSIILLYYNTIHDVLFTSTTVIIPPTTPHPAPLCLPNAHTYTYLHPSKGQHKAWCMAKGHAMTHNKGASRSRSHVHVRKWSSQWMK